MYLTTTRRPFESFQSLRRLSNVLDEAFGAWPLEQAENGAITAAWQPAVDVFVNRDSVKIVAELPGGRNDAAALVEEERGERVPERVGGCVVL